MKNLKVIAGSSHIEFAKEVCKCLNIKLTKLNTTVFSNENIMTQIGDNVREADVFVIQTSCPPVNTNIIESFLIIDALKYSSASRITAVLPYFPYVRSDKKDQNRISIAAKLMADLYETTGAERFLSMEYHSPQIQGFFGVPSDQLFATKIFCDYLKANKDIKNSVIVAADIGEVKALGPYANKLKLPIAIIDKRRLGNSDKIIPKNLIGDVENQNCIIIDDEIASGGTLCEAAKFLKAHGAKNITAAIVHPVLSGNVIEKINNSEISELIVTNTIPLGDKKLHCKKITELSVAPLFAKAIERIHNGESISSLF